MDSGNSDMYFISSAGAESLANSAQALGVSNSYTTSQSDAHSTYKGAEFLAQSEHGMTYQGGFNGGWTHPTGCSPLIAAAYMQASADLRGQTNSYHGGADRGHANSQYTAQLAANGIRNTQAMIASINRQPCNSGSIQQQQQQQLQYQLQQQQQQQQNYFNQAAILSLKSEQASIERQIQSSQNTFQKRELENKLSGLRVRESMLESQNRR
jgi:hypothetical protein